MSHIWMSHSIGISHVTHMNESCSGGGLPERATAVWRLGKCACATRWWWECRVWHVSYHSCADLNIVEGGGTRQCVHMRASWSNEESEIEKTGVKKTCADLNISRVWRDSSRGGELERWWDVVIELYTKRPSCFGNETHWISLEGSA